MRRFLVVFFGVILLGASYGLAQIYFPYCKVDPVKFGSVKKMVMAQCDTSVAGMHGIFALVPGQSKEGIRSDLQKKMCLYLVHRLVSAELRNLGTYETVPESAVQGNADFQLMKSASGYRAQRYPGTKSVWQNKKIIAQTASLFDADSVAAFRYEFLADVSGRKTNSESVSLIFLTQIYDASGVSMVKQTYSGYAKKYSAYLRRRMEWENDNKPVLVAIKNEEMKARLSLNNLALKALDENEKDRQQNELDEKIAKLESELTPLSSISTAPQLKDFVDPSFFSEEEFSQLSLYNNEIYYLLQDFTDVASASIAEIRTKLEKPGAK